MISKLKRRFTVLATASMLVLMAALVLIMNIVNYTSVVSESNTVLDVLSQTSMPMFDGKMEADKLGDFSEMVIPRGMSPEVPYESRFFTVMVASDGEIKESDLSRIVSVDSDSAEEYITEALESSKDRGFVGEFRFAKTNDGRMTKILFLDCGRKLDAFRTFLWVSIGVGLFGCLIVFVAFLFAAGRIVKPIAESYDKQKRFISDAGHEIKTPLTIINANVDIMECDGEREELTEIRSQTERLTKLTNNLVFLSKMDESEQTITKIEMPLSDVVTETANSFQAPAHARSISYTTQIQPNVTVNGAPDSIRRLVSILLENAVKYSPEGGAVTLSLTEGKKNAVLTVFNTTADIIEESDLPYVFDRFYRTDTSRNSATGGHGIGLSVAKAIVDAHGGTIAASTKNGSDFCITVTIPA